MARNKVYTNPIENHLRISYNRSKAQAQYLGQEWDLEWEDYLWIWLENEAWRYKGRGSESLCLGRIDSAKPWTKKNVQLSGRREHLQRLLTKA